MINIAEILRDCPKGTKLYSPICGDCTFEKIHLNTSIVVCTQDYRTVTFNVYGQYFRDFLIMQNVSFFLQRIIEIGIHF